MVHKGSLFIISAPSGAGKTSLVKALEKTMPNLYASVSFTTRARRSQEQAGIDYHFVSHHEFNALRAQDVFLECAEVFGNFYGTSADWVEETRLKGLDVILEIDWQGAAQACERYSDAERIFIFPPSLGVLLERLQKRHPDNIGIVQERMKEGQAEISHYTDYDYLICNDDFDRALGDLQSIVRCSRLRQAYFRAEHAALIQGLLS